MVFFAKGEAIVHLCKKNRHLNKYATLLLSFLFFFQLQSQELEEVNQNQKRMWFPAIGGAIFSSFGDHFDDGVRWNGLTFSFEFRRNLISFDDDASFSLSMPLELSLGFITINNSKDYAAFPLSVPLLLDFNLGMHSTYNNISTYGVSLSAGGMMRLIPNASGTLKIDLGPAFKFALKLPAKRKNISVYTLVGLGLDDEVELVSFSTTIGVLYLLKYGN